MRFKKREDEFMSWEDYARRKAMLELHDWQQATRRQTLRNMATEA
ncbi:MAG: hypothetical protein ACLFO2_04735 [Candidatus Woesearchaeota archaeon]